MPKKQYPHRYEDANGNTIIQFKDGASQMYIGGKDNAKKWLDVSNEADEMVNRQRYLPDITAPHVPIQTRDDAMPGVDDLDEENDNAAD